MSDLPPDLPRLRTLETWLALSLERVRQQITEAEAQAAADAARREPLPPPAWLIEQGIGVGHRPVRVHVGTCWDASKRCRPASADQARQALVDGVEACPHCRPDTELGVLD
ncbi:DUF6233 domain-containing protein [Streptomyces sp. NPDC046866]|uniref:DUF6233 domain-containing protein n=1 Tax=Streptomyces sp. NPDC046866 TaxID=3154921 RepID=UPI003455F6C6